ncbi:BZ3500_MvSof-1268-A1-R1_C128g00695 [Microbotryum saponariae]|uniref:BZ3500_MvSof-1268-A1-R1_C089g00482 protein n=1 Tax=Microbotryum saponariae TaxID=289078 RepID=A0A2X0LSB4_9BASI|nr:BZ3500_MvSof-1268-A1-R1_C089g00482 [Microbotryum saponariae]SDA04174.1 BZ3500_MvSof-1268-A1-R1_C128g00695 [Microbotryum saponariae]
MASVSELSSSVAMKARWCWFVGRLLSRCGLTVRAEVWAVHVRWAEASRESVGKAEGDDDAANDGDSAGDGDKGVAGDGDEDGSGDGDEDDSASVELSKVPPVYPGATSTALMAESSREDETSMCADLTSGVHVLTTAWDSVVGQALAKCVSASCSVESLLFDQLYYVSDVVIAKSDNAFQHTYSINSTTSAM